MNSKQVCNICGGSIVWYKMSRHMKSLHTHGDQKRFSCQHCGKKFNLKEGLTYHEKRHNNILKYSYGTCEYKTNKKAHFDCHVNAHLNIRPFCEVKTGRKDKLKDHLRNMHMTSAEVSNDWKCNKCNSTYRKDNLETHIEGRHGGIDYPCSHCDYKTTWKDYLKRHTIKKHGEASYAPGADEFVAQNGDVSSEAVGIQKNPSNPSIGSVTKESHDNKAPRKNNLRK